MRKGFTLIEMSVVLVIIGLLAAGIVLSQSMARSSKVQTIISDVATYQTAISQFKQKYNEIPGDMADAQSYWGVNPNCTTAGSAGTGTQTCNGNGDGQITFSSIAPYEQFLVWQHLANGGFITNQYTGTSVPGATGPKYYCLPGSNCPTGQVNQRQAYFLQYSAGALGSSSYEWAQSAGHYLIVGAMGFSNTGAYPAYPLLTAPEAFSLDSKIDDGLPGQGMWKDFESGGGYLTSCAVTSGTTSRPPDGSIASASNSVYYTAYSNTKPACSFEILVNF